MPSILFVPGTQATELVDADGNVAYSASGLSVLSMIKPVLAARIGRHTDEEWAELLGLEHDAGSLEPRPESVKLFPGKVLRTPYEGLYHKYGDDFQDFPYDWRWDILANGKKLLVELRKPSSADDGKWKLLGHSQGGLVILAAAALAPAGEFSTLVSHAALVGAPIAGTLRAAEALLWGRDDFGDDEGLVTMLRNAARSWPALIQMLPAWDVIVDKNKRPVDASLQLRSPHGWPKKYPLSHDQVELLPREELFHDLMKEYLRDPGDAQWKMIMGMDQKTGLFIHRNGDLPDGLKGQPTEAGDSLVPAFRTVQWAGGLINGPSNFIRPNLPHAMLLKDPEVLSVVDGFFKGRPA